MLSFVFFIRVFLFFSSESKRSFVTQITFKQFRRNPHEYTHATTTTTTKEGRHAGKTDHFHQFLLLCYSLLSQRTNYISIFDMFKNTYDAIFSPRQDEVLRWMLLTYSCDFILGIVAVDDWDNMMSNTYTSPFRDRFLSEGEMIRLNLLRGNQPFSQYANVIPFKFITYADISSILIPFLLRFLITIIKSGKH